MSHIGLNHQPVFPRILDCCYYSIHKNDKFILQTLTMADFAVWRKEAHTAFRLLPKIVGFSPKLPKRTGRLTGVSVSTLGRDFAADLLQVQQ
jgi:hypothetical protein